MGVSRRISQIKIGDTSPIFFLKFIKKYTYMILLIKNYIEVQKEEKGMRKQIIVIDDRIGVNKLMVPANEMIEFLFYRNQNEIWNARLERVIREVRKTAIV